MGMAKVLTEQNFQQEVVQSGKPAMVDFWAVWCGPCRILEPIVEDLARKYGDRALIGKVNVDENPMLAAQFGIRAIPTILFFKNGEVVDRVVGAVPQPILEEKLQALLNETVS